MKTATLLLTASVAANVALLSAFVVKPSLAPPAFRDFFSRADNSEASSTAATADNKAARDKIAAAAQARLWQTLDSADLPTLISRLRAAGFSPAVIRGIVNAQLEQRFAARLDAVIAKTAEVPFWKSEGLGTMGSMKFYEEMNQIARERGRLLRELLGNELLASAGADPNVAQRRRYGDIPKHKIELVQQIADDYGEMISQVRSATQGIVLPEDREKLALLERERRADLAAVLTPEELDEYEMRSSTTTNRLRATLTFMNATEDEFRTIFRAYQPFAEQIFPTAGMASNALEQRREAQQKVFDQLKTALGDARFTEFVRANNPEFQQLARLGETENISNDAVVQAFSLRDAASAESNRIFDDPAANPDQKRVALKALAEQMRAQAVSLLGAKHAENYLKNSNWFSTLERGAAFNFRFDGGTTRVRPLPPASRAQPAGPVTPPSQSGVLILN